MTPSSKLRVRILTAPCAPKHTAAARLGEFQSPESGIAHQFRTSSGGRMPPQMVRGGRVHPRGRPANSTGQGCSLSRVERRQPLKAMAGIRIVDLSLSQSPHRIQVPELPLYQVVLPGLRVHRGLSVAATNRRAST